MALPTIETSQLRQFILPSHPDLKEILTINHYRGDGTETGANRLRKSMSEEEYEHLHFDTIASNGRVLIYLPRYKHPEAVPAPFGFHFPPAEWLWCFEQIEASEEIEPANPLLVKRVPTDVLKALQVIQNLEWLRVRRVNLIHYGRGKPKHKHQKAPNNVLFFRFNQGLGAAAIQP